MQIPAKISFHNMDSSTALEARIRQKIAKLETKVKTLVGIHVFVEAAHHHQNKGFLYNVRIDATLPGGELVVSQHPGRNPAKHDKVFAAMNSAFAALEKQLERFKDMGYERDIKSRGANWQDGVVSNLISDEGYGFLSTIIGDEIYFHQNAVQNNRFGDLDIGSTVHFVLASESGDKGPQASAVRISGGKKGAKGAAV